MTTLALLALGALGGFFATAGVASLWADWYRIPSANGGQGYAIALFALMGGFAGAILAYIASRYAVVDGSVSFGRGVTYTAGGIAATAAAAIALLWLGADFPPKLDGERLVVEVELRTPPMYPASGRGGLEPSVMIYGEGRGRAGYSSRFKPAVREDGDRRIVATRVELASSKAKRTMYVTWSPELSFTIPISLPANPTKADFGWSEWRDAMNVEPSGGWAAAGADTRFQGRYRVQFAPPEPKKPSRAEQERLWQSGKELAERAQYDSLAAMPSSTPFEQLLGFTEYGVPEETQGLALSMMRQRDDFAARYSALVRHADADTAAKWLRLAPRFPEDLAPVAEAVRLAGEELGKAMEGEMMKIPKGDPLGSDTYPYLARFGGWFFAAFELRQKGVGDFAPEMRRILHASRTRQDLPGMRGDVTRVASYYLQQWAGDAPLPTDPPPR